MACVPIAPRKRFMLELDPDSEPIVGSLRDAEGRTYDFVGWLGFSSALGQALSPPAEAAPASGGSPLRPDPF
jgi:hypothetical protein